MESEAFIDLLREKLSFYVGDHYLTKEQLLHFEAVKEIYIATVGKCACKCENQAL